MTTFEETPIDKTKKESMTDKKMSEEAAEKQGDLMKSFLEREYGVSIIMAMAPVPSATGTVALFVAIVTKH